MSPCGAMMARSPVVITPFSGTTASMAVNFQVLAAKHERRCLLRGAVMNAPEAPADRHPIGYWLKLVDRLIDQSFDAVLDRKSTRLNSSHVKISYAVFCLKKKKELY